MGNTALELPGHPAQARVPDPVPTSDWEPWAPGNPRDLSQSPKHFVFICAGNVAAGAGKYHRLTLGIPNFYRKTRIPPNHALTPLFLPPPPHAYTRQPLVPTDSVWFGSELPLLHLTDVLRWKGLRGEIMFVRGGFSALSM